MWDSWVADDGIDYHLFFLMAPEGALASEQFLPEPELFAAPIVRLRDGRSTIIGFRYPRAQGDPENVGFEIIDPVRVTLDDEGYPLAS